MAKKRITVEVIGKEGAEPKVVDTEGYLLIYIEGESIRFTGELSLKAFGPILADVITKKFGD